MVPSGIGVDIARKAEIAQRRDELRVEQVQGREVVQRVLIEAQVFYVVDELLQPGHDGVLRDVPRVAIEHIEHGAVVAHAALLVAIHHGELVKIRQHGKIAHGYAFFLL